MMNFYIRKFDETIKNNNNNNLITGTIKTTIDLMSKNISNPVFDFDENNDYNDNDNELFLLTTNLNKTKNSLKITATTTNDTFSSTSSSATTTTTIDTLTTANHNNFNNNSYSDLNFFITNQSTLPFFKVDLSEAFHFSTTTTTTITNTPIESLILLNDSSISTTITTTTAVATNATIVNNSTTERIATIVLEPDLRIHYPGLAILLSMICVLVVFGNGLTMLSICKERYLRTVTNYFVASLAFADCLVGSIVMPFSIVHEVMNKWWIFGQNWCDLWHSFDVLASTASILNLCVISLDRYWAITDPMTYPSRMTPKKAFIFILSLWLCSALISFPAIVWWRAVQKPVEEYRCTFTDDVGYLVFSSIISFYGPLTIMVYTYYRIYVVASEQNRSLKLGVKQIEMSYIGENHHHHQQQHSNNNHSNTNNNQQKSNYNRNSSSTMNISSSSTTNHLTNNTDSKTSNRNLEYQSGFTLRIHRGGGASSTSTRHHHGNTAHHSLHYSRDKNSSSNGGGTGDSASGIGLFKSKSHKFTSRMSDDLSSYGDDDPTIGGALHQRSGTLRGHHSKATTNWSVGRRLTKLAKERKAAKTLGIVMGVFILCWMPFFVTNILMGICPETCIVEPDLVFSIVTWLGWLNSAMNPIIYACWSKDFRRAFRKLLCSCFIRNSSLSYNRNRIYKAHQKQYHPNQNSSNNKNNRYNYNLYYKSRIKNPLSTRPNFNETITTTSSSTITSGTKPVTATATSSASAVTATAIASTVVASSTINTTVSVASKTNNDSIDAKHQHQQNDDKLLLSSSSLSSSSYNKKTIEINPKLSSTKINTTTIVHNSNNDDNNNNNNCNLKFCCDTSLSSNNFNCSSSSASSPNSLSSTPLPSITAAAINTKALEWKTNSLKCSIDHDHNKNNDNNDDDQFDNNINNRNVGVKQQKRNSKLALKKSNSSTLLHNHHHQHHHRNRYHHHHHQHRASSSSSSSIASVGTIQTKLGKTTIQNQQHPKQQPHYRDCQSPVIFPKHQQESQQQQQPNVNVSSQSTNSSSCSIDDDDHNNKNIKNGNANSPGKGNSKKSIAVVNSTSNTGDMSANDNGNGGDGGGDVQQHLPNIDDGENPEEEEK